MPSMMIATCFGRRVRSNWEAGVCLAVDPVVKERKEVVLSFKRREPGFIDCIASDLIIKTGKCAHVLFQPSLSVFGGGSLSKDKRPVA